MKVILFGATGMVGQGVLRECLLDPGVDHVLSVSRSSLSTTNPKLEELLRKDVTDLPALSGYDACFFCLGVSSVGLSPDDYQKLTYDLTLAVATKLAQQNPGMTFTYVSGAGTDSSEHGTTRWARVKGATENALLRLPFKAAYMFRPGFIEPVNGETPRNKWLGRTLGILKPIFPLVQKLGPRWVTSTEKLGQAMIEAARHGAPKPVLEVPDINALAARYSR